MARQFSDEPDPAAGYVMRPEEEALVRSAQRPGATFIVGRVGTGKTTILHRLLDRERAVGRRVIVLGPGELPRDDSAASRVISNASELREALVAVDEAHQLSSETLLNLIQTVLESDAHIVLVTEESSYRDLIASRQDLAERVNTIRVGSWDMASLDELLRKRAGAEYDRVRGVLHTIAEPSPREAIKAAAKLLARSGEIDFGPVERHPVQFLDIVIDPGEASSADLARFYTALSSVYRAYGGDGLEFDTHGHRVTLREGSAL